MNILQAFYEFLLYLRAVKNASEHTIRNYAIDLNAFKSHWEKALLSHLKEEQLPQKMDYRSSYEKREGKERDSLLSLSSFNRSLIRSFLAEMNQAGQNRRTIVRRLAALRTFSRYALAHQLITVDPLEELETPKIEKKIPYSLSYEQILQFLALPDLSSYLGFRDRTILELFYSSGLRVGELAALSREDLDLDSLLLKLKGKGRKERIVPITQTAAQWLQDYLKHPERGIDTEDHLAQQDDAALFLNKWGTRLTTRSIDRIFVHYLRRSGWAAKVTPHTFRHTIATHWLENGMDLKTIQVILGHSCLTTTTLYTKVSTQLKKKVFDESHPRAKRR